MPQTSFQDRLARLEGAKPAPAPRPQPAAAAMPKAPLEDHWIKDVLLGFASMLGTVAQVAKFGFMLSVAGSMFFAFFASAVLIPAIEDQGVTTSATPGTVHAQLNGETHSTVAQLRTATARKLERAFTKLDQPFLAREAERAVIDCDTLDCLLATEQKYDALLAQVERARPLE